MGKSETLDLVRSLTLVPPEEGTLDRYYDETLIELGEIPFVFAATLLPVSIDQAVFDIPDFAVNVLQVFYDARCLDRASLQEMQSLSPTWRDVKGASPCTYVTEHEDERTFRIWPMPAMPSQAFSFVTGSPLGLDLPSYAVMTLHTSHPQDGPVILELLIAHRMLAREFARESQHQDVEYAKRCEQIAQILLNMLKLNHA